MSQGAEDNSGTHAAPDERDLCSSLIAASRDFIALLDGRGKLLNANPAALSDLGYSLEEVREHFFIELVPKAEHPLVLESFRALASGGEQIRFRTRLPLAADGRQLPADIAASAISGQDGERRIILIARDISLWQGEVAKLTWSRALLRGDGRFPRRGGARGRRRLAGFALQPPHR